MEMLIVVAIIAPRMTRGEESPNVAITADAACATPPVFSSAVAKGIMPTMRMMLDQLTQR